MLESRGWERMSAEAFFRDDWQPLRIDASDAEPDLAFRMAKGAPGDLRLALHPTDATSEGNVHISWQLGSGRADFRAEASWSEIQSSKPLEWDLPDSVVVTEVHGAGVRSWSRIGSRLQAWLAGVPSGGRASLVVTGWTARPTEDAIDEKTPFSLPWLNLRGVSKQNTIVHVKPRDGWRVFLGDAAGLRPLPSTDLPGAEWSGFGSESVDAKFLVRPARGLVESTSVTVAELSGRFMAFTSAIDVRTAGDRTTGSIQTLTIDVRRTDPDRLQLLLPPQARLRETRPATTGVTWVVDCPPGRHRIVVAGRVPVPTSRELAMPSVSARGVGGAPSAQRWVAVAGDGLRACEAVGVNPELPPVDMLDPQQNEKLRRSRASWLVANEEWRLLLAAATGGESGTSSFNRSELEVAAAANDDGHWLIRARSFIFTESDVSWTVRSPADARLIAFSIDGVEQPLANSSEGQPVTSRAIAQGVHAVRMVWRTRMTVPAAPGFFLPRLEIGDAPVPWSRIIWSVMVPDGFKLAGSDDRIGPASFELRRTAAWLDMYRNVAERASTESLLPLRAAIHGAFRRAELDIAASPNSSRERGPAGQSLAEWLKQQRDAAPPAALAAPVGAEPYEMAFQRGTPNHRRTSGVDVPLVHLEQVDLTLADRAVMSGMFLVLVVFGALVTRRMR